MTSLNTTTESSSSNIEETKTSSGPGPNYSIQEWDDSNLNLDTNILRGIYAYGFEQPSPIQKKALYPMTMVGKDGKRRDIIAQAQSGTGKTGCFTVAVETETVLSMLSHTFSRVGGAFLNCCKSPGILRNDFITRNRVDGDITMVYCSGSVVLSWVRKSELK